MLVTCPSGLRGEVREWTVADEDVLAQAIDRGAGGNAFVKIEGLIRDSWMGTVDAGPYGAMERLDLDRILSVDLLYILVQARINTWGADVVCSPACPGGNHAAEGLADLSKCEVKRIKPEVAKAMREGKAIELVLPRTKRKIGLHLLTRQIERAIADTHTEFPKEKVTRGLLARVAWIEGFNEEEGVDQDTKLPMFEWFRQLPGRDSMAIKGKMVEIDPGYDTEALVRCGTCGKMALAEVTEQADFFAPTGRAEALRESFSSSSPSAPTSPA